MNIIIFSQYYKPVNHISVDRVFNLVQSFSNRGHFVKVVTVDPFSMDSLQSRLTYEKPDSHVQHIENKSLVDSFRNNHRSKKSYKVLKKIYHKVILPFMVSDNLENWCENVKKEKSVFDRDYNIIITTGPPHSIHNLGSYYKNKSNIFWIADFRDKWSLNACGKNNYFSNKIIERKEKTVFNNCDLITYVDKSTVKKTNKQSYHLLNGYSKEDFKSKYNYSKTSKLNFSYFGSLYSKITPFTFLRALEELINEDGKLKDIVQVHFYGQVSDFDMNQYIKEHNLDAIVFFHGFIDKTSAIKRMCKSDILLFFLAPEHKHVYSGKIYEYIASKRFILAEIPVGGVISDLISDNKLGFSVNNGEVISMKEKILKIRHLWENNLLNVNNIELEPFQRKVINNEFICFLETLVAND